MKRVSVENGKWPLLISEWEKVCDDHLENFSDYATASLPVLDELATGTQRAFEAVYAHEREGKTLAICQANTAFLPGYKGKVLRIRHIVFSPQFDLSEEVTLEDYWDALGGVFLGALDLSIGEMAAPSLKFHLKSPAERMFGHEFTKIMKEHGEFDEAAMRGSWIYLTKT